MASKRKTALNYLRDTTLAAITVAGGYNNTVATVKRGLEEIDNLPESKFPAIYITRTQEDRNNITRDKFFGDIQAYLVGYVKNSTGTTGVQEQLDDLIEDITKAVEQDRTLGGNVKWLEIVSILTDDGDMQSYGACVVVVKLRYATEGTAP